MDRPHRDNRRRIQYEVELITMVMNYEWERPGGMMNVPPLTEPRWIGKGIGRGVRRLLRETRGAEMVVEDEDDGCGCGCGER